MEDVKKFILKFLEKEAEAWTKMELGDLDDFNQSIKELYAMATEDLDEAFGIFKEDELTPEDDPQIYMPAHLFKLTAYNNNHYGDIWIAYTSYKHPPVYTSRMTRGFIISRIDDKLKIIGCMSVDLDELYMEPTNWEASVYNPKELDIYHLGKFLSTERHLEPEDDGFGLKNYLEDEMCVNNPLDEDFFEGAVSVELQAEDIKTNRKVIESMIKKGIDVKVEWI